MWRWYKNIIFIGDIFNISDKNWSFHYYIFDKFSITLKIYIALQIDLAILKLKLRIMEYYI